MSNRIMRFGLVAKFCLLVSLPLLFVSLALTANFMYIAGKFIRMGLTERGIGVSVGLSRLSEYGILVEDRQMLTEALRSFDQQDLLCSVIRNASGDVLVSRGDMTESMLDRTDVPTHSTEIRSPLGDQETALSVRVLETDDLQSFICDVVTIREWRSREDIGLSQSTSSSGHSEVQNIGTVEVVLSKYSMMSYINKAKLGALFLGSGVTAIAVLLAIFIVNAMTKPIKRLAVAAGKVSHGDFDQTVEAKSNDEIGDLTGSFNKMLTDLKKASDENLIYRRELEKKAQELTRSNAELNSFVYTVSHDLKAPVVSLQGFSSLLLKDYKGKLDGSGELYIERILKNSERMGLLIENLLELSRIGRIKGQEASVNVSDIISEVEEDLAPQLESRGTKLIVKDEMPVLLCDRTRIGQVFANLISNSNKFMGDDNTEPTIEVGHDVQDGDHRFYVKDNGIGIDEKYYDTIFQIFQRLDDIETEGTGVGLAIVKKIVENLGGKIWVKSKKGEGTTIYFTVPESSAAKEQQEEL